jgi:hypothetical protein
VPALASAPHSGTEPQSADQDSGDRRWSWRDWYLVVVLGGVMAFCLGPSLVGLRTLISVNLLTPNYPFNAIAGNQSLGHERCSGDTINAAMPGIAHVRAQLFAGHLAAWQNVVSGGGPLSSVPDLGLLDPLSLPYLILPLWLAPAFVVLLSFIAAAGGTFLFLRLLGLSRPASTLAGLVFATSGFMVMWTNWPQTRVAALIPLLFWAVERLIQRTRLVDVVPVAVVLASMIFGGFPVITGYSIYLVVGYFIVRVFLRHRFELSAWVRTAGLAALGIVLGALVTMVQLLPFVDFYRHADLAYRTGDAKEGLPFAGLITLVAPNSNGLCVAGHPTFGGVNPIELVAFVGAAAMVLAICGAAFGGAGGRGRVLGVRAYFAIAVVVIVFLGWGSPPFRVLTAHLPAFADNFIGRIRSVLGFALAVLAAVGFDWVTRGRQPAPAVTTAERRRRTGRWVWIGVVWAGALVAGVVVLVAVHHAAVLDQHWSDVKHAIWIPFVLIVVALALVAASRIFPRRGPLVAFVVLPLLVAAQSAQFFHAVLPGDNPSDFYPVTATHRYLAAHLGDDRFASSGGTMYGGTALYYDLRTPTGHFFTEPAWRDLLQAVDPKVMLSPTFSNFSPTLDQTTVGDQPILDRMGVKYFVLPPQDLAGTVVPVGPTDGALRLGAGTATCTVTTAPLTGVTFQLAAPAVASDAARGFTVSVAVHYGAHTLPSARYFIGPAPAGPISIAVPGESVVAGDQARVTIRATGVAGGLRLASANGSPACSLVRPVADGLRLVYADAGSIIYRRLDAMPRIRWASRAVVIRTASGRIAALEHGLPHDEVVLDAPAGTASGRGARFSDVQDNNDDRISATVTSRGAGYLVVADAMQQRGWTVTVDGHPAHLLPADEAMVAVPVPAGTHTIEMRYRAPGQLTGAVISFLAVIALVVILLRERARRRHRPRHRRRGHGADPEAAGAGGTAASGAGEGPTPEPDETRDVPDPLVDREPRGDTDPTRSLPTS